MSLGLRVVRSKAQTRLNEPPQRDCRLRPDDAFKHNIDFSRHISQTPQEFHWRRIKVGCEGGEEWAVGAGEGGSVGGVQGERKNGETPVSHEPQTVIWIAV